MATNNMSKNASWDAVKFDKEAIEFHAYKFSTGSVYSLAKTCFQYLELKKLRSVYEYYQEEVEGKNGNNAKS